MEKWEKFVGIREECFACKKCVIGGQTLNGHLRNVFSNMNDKADIMVVGQNPGSDEVEKGEPFVGPSGATWDKFALEILGMDRNAFYISNVVKCWTPGNQKPSQDDMENCRLFLDREVEAVSPKFIIALGSLAMKQLTGMSGIMKHVGQPIFSPRYKTSVVPILHPSPLNMNNPTRHDEFIAGLWKLKRWMDGLEQGR